MVCFLERPQPYPWGRAFGGGVRPQIGLRERHAPFKREGRCRPRCHLPVSGLDTRHIQASLYGHAPEDELTSGSFGVFLAAGLWLGAIRSAASVCEPSPSLPPKLASPVVTAPCAVFGRPHLPTGFAAPSPSHREHPSQLALRVSSRSGVQSPRPNPGSTAALVLPSGPAPWRPTREGTGMVSAPLSSAVASQTGSRRRSHDRRALCRIAGEIIPSRRGRVPRGRSSRRRRVLA